MEDNINQTQNKTTPVEPSSSPGLKNKRHPVTFLHILKIVAWVIMGIVLFVAGILIGVVNILNPARLTPIVEKLATQSLINSRVEIDTVELSIMNSFPFLHADVKGMKVISTVRELVDEDTRSELPDWTDTLMRLDRFEGGLNLVGLLKNRLDFSDVTIVNPSANIVVVDDSISNFNIFPPTPPDEEPFDIKTLPQISLTRFEIVDPGNVRYFDLSSGTDLAFGFTQVDFIGKDAPLYTLDFDGELKVPSEVLEIFSLDDIKFGLNGDLFWEQKNPTHLELRNFRYMLSLISGTISTSIDFDNQLKFNSLDMTVDPISIQKAISIIPEDIAEEFNIPKDIVTDATIALGVSLKAPWIIGADELPKMTVNLSIPQSSLTWNDLVLENLTADLTLVNNGNDLNSAYIDINNLQLAGPATNLTIKGRLSNLMPIYSSSGDEYTEDEDSFTFDPTFDGTIDGTCDFFKLPPQLLSFIPGRLSGLLTAHVSFRGAPSMFTPTDFYRLKIGGDMAINNLYYLSEDTVNMVNVGRLSFKFGTDKTFVHDNVRTDSLLSVTLGIDTATVVHSDIEMGFKNFELALSTANRSTSSRHDRVNGSGGKLSLSAFNMVKANDSILLKVRDVKGYTVIKPHDDNVRLPHFIFDLSLGRLATGNPENRLMIRNASTHIDAFPQPQSRRAKAIAATADSLHRALPHLSADSVIALAIARHRPSRYHRVHAVVSDSTETIDWGTTSVLKKILVGWKFKANVSSSRGAFFSPYFPMRNRLRNLNVSLTNDSILVKGMQYKVGHSDFLINGVVSNLRRALTSESRKVPMKIHFDVISDTIDVNQLTDLTLAGAAYSARKDSTERFSLDRFGDDELAMERALARNTAGVNDSIMPLLIPRNIDAELGIRANNILYSDLQLTKFQGRVLIYNGAVNLDSLRASSDFGTVDISALYTGRHPNDLHFGFGMKLNDFNLHRFLRLVPAVDSLLPVLRDFSGFISTDIAATVDIDKRMDLVLPSLEGAIAISGDSLVLLDPDTFKSLSKWLFFKDKNRNMIDHMDVQMIIHDDRVTIYPFIFNFDRYKLGVQGANDFNMNFDYHIAVLKSPIPFKFGINISGNPDKYKIRLGGAKFGEKQLREVSFVDTTRINLMNEIRNVFKRGAREARLSRLNLDAKARAATINLGSDTLTHADSLRFIQEGLIPAPIVPDTIPSATPPSSTGSKKDKKKQRVKPNSSSPLFTLLPLAIISRNRRRRRISSSSRK